MKRGNRPPKDLVDALIPRTPKKNGPRHASPFPKTMQEEMALAVILWRAVRFSYTAEKKMLGSSDKYLDNDKVHRCRQEDKVNDTAIEMARRMGVLKEFFELLFEFPVFKLYLMGLERWPDTIRGIVPRDRELVEATIPVPPKPKKGK